MLYGFEIAHYTAILCLYGFSCFVRGTILISNTQKPNGFRQKLRSYFN